MWNWVNDRLKKRGSLWTTSDEEPTQEDLNEICEYVESGTFAVAYRGQAIRHFRLDKDGLHFVESEGFFRPDGLPRYCTDKMAAFLHHLPEDTFSPQDIEYLDADRTKYYLREAEKEGWVEHLDHATWIKTLD